MQAAKAESAYPAGKRSFSASRGGSRASFTFSLAHGILVTSREGSRACETAPVQPAAGRVNSYRLCRPADGSSRGRPGRKAERLSAANGENSCPEAQDEGKNLYLRFFNGDGFHQRYDRFLCQGSVPTDQRDTVRRDEKGECCSDRAAFQTADVFLV